MILIVDTNILISALIKDAATRRLVVEIDADLYTPETTLKEILKHTGLIQRKSGLPKKDLTALIDTLLSYLSVVPERDLADHLPQATKLLGQFDPDDAVFLAAALSRPDSAIWSNDADLKQQHKVPVYTTQELITTFRL